MASNAFTACFTRDKSTNHLLVSLFGTDPKRYVTVVEYFAKFSSISLTEEFVIIFDDQGVKWELDQYQETPDLKGVWTDHRYSWSTGFDQFVPCYSTRKLDASL